MPQSTETFSIGDVRRIQYLDNMVQKGHASVRLYRRTKEELQVLMALLDMTPQQHVLAIMQDVSLRYEVRGYGTWWPVHRMVTNVGCYRNVKDARRAKVWFIGPDKAIWKGTGYWKPRKLTPDNRSRIFNKAHYTATGKQGSVWYEPLSVPFRVYRSTQQEDQIPTITS